MSRRLGVDLGGTKIEAVVLEGERELVRRRVPTPAGDYESIVDAVARLVAAAEEVAGPTLPTVGIGTPGAVSPVTGMMKNSNSTALNGKPLDRDLAAAIGRPIRMRNDADCFALAEAVSGAGRGASVVFGVILGTGVGGGIVVGGTAITGPNRTAGEFGHIPLPWPLPDEHPGPDCYCGKTGCVERYLSGPSFAADHARHAGVELEPPAIVAAARDGDQAAAASLARYVDRLARSLAVVIDIVDPDVVVLGGGMSNVDELYGVGDLLAGYVFGGDALTPVRRNVHGDSAGVLGAAMLVDE